MAWCLDMGVPWPAPHVLWYTDPGWTMWARKPACPALGTADRLGVGPETHHAGRWPQDTASRVSVLFSRCRGFCVDVPPVLSRGRNSLPFEIPVFSKWFLPSGWPSIYHFALCDQEALSYPTSCLDLCTLGITQSPPSGSSHEVELVGGLSLQCLAQLGSPGAQQTCPIHPP